MMRQFVLKNDKIHVLKHEKHGETFDQFRFISSSETYLGKKKQNRKLIIPQIICRIQKTHDLAQNRPKKSRKYAKSISVEIQREMYTWLLPEDSKKVKMEVNCQNVEIKFKTPKNSHQMSLNYRPRKVVLLKQKTTKMSLCTKVLAH